MRAAALHAQAEGAVLEFQFGQVVGLDEIEDRFEVVGGHDVVGYESKVRRSAPAAVTSTSSSMRTPPRSGT